jgi:hypothetical protein
LDFDKIFFLKFILSLLFNENNASQVIGAIISLTTGGNLCLLMNKNLCLGIDYTRIKRRRGLRQSGDWCKGNTITVRYPGIVIWLWKLFGI